MKMGDISGAQGRCMPGYSGRILKSDVCVVAVYVAAVYVICGYSYWRRLVEVHDYCCFVPA